MCLIIMGKKIWMKKINLYVSVCFNACPEKANYRERERERREAQTLKNSRWDVKFCVEFKGQSLRVVFTIGRKNGQKQLLKVSADAPLSGFTLFPPPFLSFFCNHVYKFANLFVCACVLTNIRVSSVLVLDMYFPIFYGKVSSSIFLVWVCCSLQL